jgi:hypothetical protein
MEYTLQSDIGDLFAISMDVHHRHQPGDAVQLTLQAKGVTAIPDH